MTMPTIASFGAASRIARAAARHSTPADAVAMFARPAPEPSLTVIAASGSREMMSRSGLRTATTAAKHPTPGGCRDALPADHALRVDRERRAQVAGVGVEQVDRKLVPQQQSEDAREDSQLDRVKQQHGDYRPEGVAVTAQVGDQAPALLDGEQHRVARMQTGAVAHVATMELSAARARAIGVAATGATAVFCRPSSKRSPASARCASTAVACWTGATQGLGDRPA
jgi:hypothetical protein